MPEPLHDEIFAGVERPELPGILSILVRSMRHCPALLEDLFQIAWQGNDFLRTKLVVGYRLDEAFMKAHHASIARAEQLITDIEQHLFQDDSELMHVLAEYVHLYPYSRSTFERLIAQGHKRIRFFQREFFLGRVVDAALVDQCLRIADDTEYIMLRMEVEHWRSRFASFVNLAQEGVDFYTSLQVGQRITAAWKMKSDSHLERARKQLEEMAALTRFSP